jgi:hypothetical protein
MIVDDLDTTRAALFPLEDHAPLSIDPNRVESLQSALQSLEPIAGRSSQILQPTCSMQILEFALRHSSDITGKLPSRGRMQVMEQVVGELISERADHAIMILS